MTSENKSKLEKLVYQLIKKQPKLIDYDLVRLETVLSRLRSPQSSLKNIIHVAGTNGKGSTIANLRALLSGHRFSVNSFTSPHLIKINERININGKNISDDKLLAFLLEVIEVKDKIKLSYFEILTCASFMAFKGTESDFNLIEVGLGGKRDATNVIENPLACLITPISLDHKEFLGDKISNIALEKAGIIKKNVPVFLGKQDESVAEIIKHQADSLKCPLFEHGKDWKIEKRAGRYFFKAPNSLINIESKALKGDYQLENAALALGTLYYLNLLNPKNAAGSLKKVIWPGRFQYLRKGPLYNISKAANKNNEIIIDGAHNPGGACALSQEIRGRGWKNVYLILAMQKNKDLIGFMKKFIGLIKAVYIIDCAYDNFYTISEARKALISLGYRTECSTSTYSSVTSITQESQSVSNLILITGSLQLMGEVLEKNS